MNTYSTLERIMLQHPGAHPTLVRKRAVMTGILNLIAVLVCTSYAVYDWYWGIYYSLPFQAICASTTALAWWVNRKGMFTLSKVTLGVTVNLTVFGFCLTEPAGTGLSLYFATCALGAFAAFGFEERCKAIFFAVFSLTLFVVSTVFQPHWFMVPRDSESYQQINLIVNFVASSVASLVVVYFLVSVNFRSEKQLMDAEARLAKQNSELVKINAELDRFVYSTSHDLRAPLSSISGLLRLIRMADDPDQKEMYLGLIEGRIETLKKFIQEIADYSRNARTDITAEEVKWGDLVDEVLEVLRFFPGSERIHLKKQYPADLTICTDRNRLRTILANLLSNAFKYADGHKQEPYVCIAAELKPGSINIHIEDNGLGIAREYHERVFDMFFRAHQQSDGSGLGLYIVRESIDRLGGTIGFQSEPRVGTTFNVQIPLQRAHAGQIEEIL
ncbi:MAG: HAMP domain-containing histidine kinase [Cyclobacteriaceae bacterium]|nr:HAMP domain-containing histidine kinase [Cyclobacteriaceae bacterium]